MKIPSRSSKDYAFLVLKGMAMGAADVVPGVSGGTIAFITGIYDELLHSLSQLTPKTLLTWKQEGFVAAWKSINGTFLVVLFSGVLISLVTFARIIGVALERYPILVWSFFFGLIIASIIFFGRQQRGWRWQEWLALVCGAGLVYWISIAAPAQLPAHPAILFAGGFIAICAMILPGISGSFLLLLMGLYPAFLRAINEVDVIALASFLAGCVSGLLVFSRFLSWLLDNYHRTTLATLIGFLIGSLSVTWPWKQIVQTVTDRHGEVIPLVQRNILPQRYAELAGDPMLMAALISAAAGILLVLLTEMLSSISDRSGHSELEVVRLKDE